MDSKESIYTNDKICFICNKQFSNYTCPKCNAEYCSMGCYKNHSQNCTDDFNKRNLKEALQSKQNATKEEKEKMVQILNRIDKDGIKYEDLFQDETEEEEDEEEEFNEKLLEKLDLEDDECDVDELLQLLTPTQRKEFENSIKNESIFQDIQCWKPWWIEKKEKSKRNRIIEISSNGEPSLATQEQTQTSIPNILSDIKPFYKLTSSKPPVTLIYNLMDILYSYCLCSRIYNGDWKLNHHDAIFSMINVSLVLSLKMKTPYLSCSVLIQEMLQSARQPNMCTTSLRPILTIKDVSKLLTKENTMIALSDIFILMKETKIFLKKQKKTKENNRITQAQLKINFFLSWCNEQDVRLYEMAKEEVKEEFQKYFSKINPN